MKDKIITPEEELDSDSQQVNEDDPIQTQTTSEEKSANSENATALSTIEKFTASEKIEQRPNISLREILGGDILTGHWIRRQIWLILLCVAFIIIYITNRYSAQQEIIKIESLKTELATIRYYALTRSSELTIKSRQSQIEKGLVMIGDSTLCTPKEPPFKISKKPEE